MKSLVHLIIFLYIPYIVFCNNGLSDLLFKHNQLCLSIFLCLLEPPVIQAHPLTLDVILNNHVTLPCRALGTPRPTITWQKEGINIATTG